jgi:hypothetical protein
MSVDKQKLEVPEPYVKGIQHIIAAYPSYCAFEDLPGFDDGDDFAKFLGELANLQILVVQ